MLTLLRGKHFKVKLLYFKEGGSISMQRHKHRSELWLLVFGLMEIMNGELGDFKAGHWEVIEEMEWHKFKAKKPSLVLECQFGSKCKENDIERQKCLS